MDDFNSTKPSSGSPEGQAPNHNQNASINHASTSLPDGAQTAEVLRWAASQLAAVRPWDSVPAQVAQAAEARAESPESAEAAQTRAQSPESARARAQSRAESPESAQAASVTPYQGASVTTPETPETASEWEAEQIARSEAQWLLEWAAGWTRSNLLTRMHEAVPSDALQRFQPALERRLAGNPLQYIIGYAPFYGRNFTVRPGCLIPRPETEILADEAIRFARKHLKSGCMLDVGTGSGALAITIKLECPGLDVCAVDVSSEALSIARENADKLSADVTFLEVDAFKWLGLPFGLPSPVRMIVSNPPYIPKQEIEALSADVKEHEPLLALEGGFDGLDFYRLFAERASRCFAPGPAAILLEVGAGQAEDVRALFAGNEEFAEWKFDVVPDLRAIPRVVRGVRVQE